MERKLNEKAWQAYQAGVERGELVSLRELGLSVGPRVRTDFVSSRGDEAAAQGIVDRLITLWENRQGKDSGVVEDERKIIELGVEFLDSVEYGMRERIRMALDSGFPVNFQDPKSKETALHISASKIELNDLSNQLLDEHSCDLLLRDRFGKLAWNNAVFFNPSSEELIDRLASETKAAADAEGIDLFEEQAVYQVQWFSQSWFLRLPQSEDFPEGYQDEYVFGEDI